MNRELRNYVSNLDERVYTIYNLPEEVIATLFAYISRNSKSCRDNLLMVSEDRAAQFHEKWVLNYGHASVAELAVVHFGIEKVSRLFSSILERSELHTSFLEFSQRYQMPQPGAFHIPSEFVENYSLKSKYIEYQNQIYDSYRRLYLSLISYLEYKYLPNGNKEIAISEWKMKSLAYEDARYILTLAVYTNLGMTVNARALEQMLVQLLSSEYSEVRERASEMKREALNVVPTLVKYAKPSPFVQMQTQMMNDFSKTSPFQEVDLSMAHPLVKAQLVDYTGMDKPNAEEYALEQILSHWFYRSYHRPWKTIVDWISKQTFEYKQKQFFAIFDHKSAYDVPPEFFHLVEYHFELWMSESCWHQFLRHRKIHIVTHSSGIESGFIVPKSVMESGNIELFQRTIDLSNDLFSFLRKQNSSIADYAITNAHGRFVKASIDMWNFCYVVRLRTAPHAHWEIRNLFDLIVDQVKNVHPTILECLFPSDSVNTE